MYARTFLASISLIIALSSGARIYAMDEESFSRGLIKRVLTTKAAVVLGYCLNESRVPPEIKIPLFTALFMVGTYGLEWDRRPILATTTSQLLQLAHSGTALTSTAYLLGRLNLPRESKARIYSALCGITLWRLCKQNAGNSYDY